VTAEEHQKQTDEEGAFRFRGLLKWSPPGQLPGFSIVATKEGCASAQATHIYVAGEDGTMHLKDPIVLRPGYSVRLQVLSEDGQPVEGAWVQSNASGFQIVKSGVDGNCVLENLPEGTTAVGVSYGSDGASSNVVASPSTPSASAVVVRLKKRSAKPTATASKPKVKRVAVGEAAPEWSISQWTDAKEHSLAALRGKVVVIEFWDFGCGPCKAITMPVSNALQPKYAKDVAFVHIHPAGEELSFVREWLAAQPWDMLVGFDKGTGPTDSETLKRYGVDGYPEIFIVDRQGRIIDNGENAATEAQEMARRKVLAEEAGLPWPIEKDASEGEKIRRLQLFHEHWMTKKIQAALAKE
jgi:thiol-disulfide isomerase/thioredoxin